MTPLFRKLNLSTQREIVVLNAPGSFEAELKALRDVSVRRSVDKRAKLAFGLAFATTQKELDDASAKLAVAAEGDAIVWIAYPKGTSKRYRCEFNRDSGWTVLGEAGFEGVRGVAIDEDWSALRFRRVDYIKSMRRAPERALSTAGRKRTARP